jgi:hypothetical protein
LRDQSPFHIGIKSVLQNLMELTKPFPDNPGLTFSNIPGEPLKIQIYILVWE